MTKYYCQQKFNWAQVSMFDGKIQSCCKASEDSVSLNLISTRPFGFFNYEKIQQDRQDMLDGKKISSCSYCWNLEEQGLPSRRTGTGSDLPTITTVDNCVPETLNILLGNLCAMTCIYCCKKFSQAWRRDLIQNGDYDCVVTDDPRHRISTKDKLLIQLSQNKLQESKYYHEILWQIQKGSTQIKKILISGGEPFLSSNLQEILDIFIGHPVEIWISTGLGIKSQHFAKQLATLDKQQIKFSVSAENVGKFHEFSRFGSRYQEFLANLQILKNLGFQYLYNPSISNTTIFGLPEFVESLDVDIDSTTILSTVDIVAEPDYLAPNVIDDVSKDLIISKIRKYKTLAHLIPIVQISCTEIQRRNANAFITEFSNRRGLSLDIFPVHFLSWLQKS